MQGYCNHTLIEVLNCQPFWVTFFVLFGLCYLYNKLIDWTFKKGYERDTTVWFVVGGVIGVLIAFAIVYGVDAALTVFFLFGSSGLMMIIGAFRRNANRTAEDREAQERAARALMNGDRD